MINLTAKIEQMTVEQGRRILVTSDIHGNLSYFKKLLEKAEFCGNDILFIVGDIVEKGNENLNALRYVMELCEQGNVFPLIGNVDANRLKIINELCEDNVNGFYKYILNLREWAGTSFYEELANECGYTLNSAEDVLSAKKAVIAHFEKEFSFLTGLPTVIETQSFVLVHGGLREKQVADNIEKSIFELTKFDAFMETAEHSFDKYVIAGHWPVCLYNNCIQQFNPIINHDKRIISIDGGCGVKKDGQLNLLIISDINCSADEITYISYDEIPVVTALENQEASANSVHISWVSNEIRIINKGEEFSLIEHVQSGKKLQIPTTYLRGENKCSDYTDYVLPVNKGDRLSLITQTSKGCIVKKDGVTGWYYGKYV
ncbi:MAG: metallophosphoesterase [Clostridia bacterium]|nr:metallophosphoesterase [Clostridia bacterium]